MTQAVQLRKGTTSEHSTFTGLQAEATVDTTKKTIVVHDGSTAGGIPLSREDLSNANPSNLTTIVGADTASGDLFVVYDVSASAFKKITRAELNNAMEQDALASVAITGGSINGTTIGASTASTGAFTTLSASSTVTLSGGTANGVLYLNGSKVATSGSALTFDGTTLTASASAASTGVFKATSTAAQVANLQAQNDAGTALFMGVFGSAAGTSGTLGASSPFVSTNGTQLVFNVNNNSGNFVWGIGATPAEQMRLTSTGLGIGTSSPQSKLSVSNSGAAGLEFSPTSGYLGGGYIQGYNRSTSAFIPVEVIASQFAVVLASTQAMTLDASGNLLVGKTSSTYAASNRSTFEINNTDSSIIALQYGGANGYYLQANSTAGYLWNSANTPLVFGTNNTERARITSGGDLLVGDTSAGYNLANRGLIELNGTSSALFGLRVGAANKGYLLHEGTNLYLSNDANGAFIVNTNNTERARITSGGALYVGTTNDNPVTSNAAGIALSGAGVKGLIIATVDGGDIIAINRKTDDGNLVTFHQDGTLEGTISVSGNTVSYNAFAGSHWSQLQDGSKPDILRGTVMESINELCVWPDEQNERLPKSKISDTAGSKKVYGVFMTWDNDWTATNDMYITAVGAFICRVNGGVTVQEGDLLESNGDGTARVQADDIIRSSTIGKVTSTVKTHEYDDGSYCVPTVLYCG